MRSSNRWWMILVLAGLPILAAAQQARIAGTVTDPRGDPVAYAEVEVLPHGLHTYASSKGVFSLGPFADGSYGVRIRRFGFTPQTVKVTMSGGNQVLRVVLNPLPVQLDTVKQFAIEQDLPRVFERAREGMSVLKFGPELRAEFPGFSIDDILGYDSDFNHELGGFPCANVYLDGKKFTWRVGGGTDAAQFPLHSLVRMKNVAAMEVIRFAGNKMHEPWFDHHFRGGSMCAVMIWTKGFKQKPYKGP